MRWRRGGGISGNIEDRRGAGGGGWGRFGGGGFPFPGGGGGGRFVLPRGKLGIAVMILVLVLGVCFGGNSLLSGGGGFDMGGASLDGIPAPSRGQGRSSDPFTVDADREAVEFVSFVLDDIQQTWDQSFEDSGRDYVPARLVLFEGAVDSACGSASSAMGPFYCPADERVYLDLGFFRDLSARFGAPGDFAEAYVIAHEIGHHVQNLLGISGRVHSLQQRHPDDANELSVRLELQADCLAGVWANSTYRRELLEEGDVEEALGAAAAVGDDRIQRQAAGTVNPESFTHGSSEQRMEWFRRGFETGNSDNCDTFRTERF